jgi:aminotransferase
VTTTGGAGPVEMTFEPTGEADAAVIAEARKVHDFLTVGAATPLQEAAVTALEFPDEYYSGLAQSYAHKREVFLEEIARTGLAFTEPEGAYFVLLDVSPLGHASDLAAAEWITREIGVAGVPGSSFFREPEQRYVRFHFAKGEEVLRGAGERLARLRGYH